MSRILIVEDDTMIRALYKRVLEKDGHQVEEASDGNEGFSKMFEGGYDLVLLDIMLPGMNGLDVIKKLKDESTPKVKNKKLVILSNLDDQTVKSDSDFYGADGYLVKSNLDVTKLTEILSKYLG